MPDKQTFPMHFGLLTHELLHLLLTVLAAGIIIEWLHYKKMLTKKLFFLVLAGALIGEFFLDTDHLFDYFLAFGFQFRPDYFFSGRMFEKLHKTYVPFHSWELLIVFGVIIQFVKNSYVKYFLFAILLGMLFHLVYDTYYSHFYFQGYSFVFRAIHNFNPKYFSFSNEQ